MTIDIDLLHMYDLSVLPPKQHNIPLIVSCQINTANVSPNLTDAHIDRVTIHAIELLKEQFTYMI